jgi:hypothetical protein
MEYITTALRSQVCLGENTEPITAGNQNGVTFYANLSANPDAAQQRTLSYNPTTKDIVDEVRDGAGTYPDLTFPGKATKTVRVLSSAVPMVENTTTQPMFRFYTYKAGTSTGELTQLGVPLNSETAPQVVMVKVAFFARPETLKVNDHMATSLQSDIYVRLADPTRPAEGPRCL